MTFILETCSTCGRLYKYWEAHNRKYKCDEKQKQLDAEKKQNDKKFRKIMKEHPEFDGRKNCWWASQKI